jgi:polysaccharide pyruvyl transferase WcaK-like protein
MNILLDCSNYFGSWSNLGDVALFQAAGWRLTELFPKATIRILTAAPSIIREQCKPLEPLWCENVHTRQWFLSEASSKWPLDCRWPIRRGLLAVARASGFPPLVRGRSRELLGLPGVEAYFQSLWSADLVLLTGGGYFTEDFAEHTIGLLDTLAGAQRLGRPTAIMSPGFEPVTNSDVVAKAKAVLPNVALVGCRDRLTSPGVLRTFGVADSRVAVTGDDAIEVAIAGTRERSAHALGFNVRIAPYSQVTEPLARLIGAAVTDAARQCCAPILGLPINLVAPSDWAAIECALDGTNAVRDGAPPPATPADLVRHVERCRAVVTGSYHAAVFALACGVPVVALAMSDHYRRKFQGLADLFQCGCEVIDLMVGAPAERIRAGAIKAWHEADALHEPLRAKALQLLEVQREFWKRLRDLV